MADGKSLEGTGTEDFFNSAWYFPEQPFAGPFAGLTWKQALPPQVAAYRWMLPDALPFERELRFDFEHGNRNNSDDLEFRWLACFYAEPGATWQIADDLEDNPTGGPDPKRDADRATTVRRYVMATGGVMLALLFAATLASLWRGTKRKNTAP